jgi:hyperosmotically inducible protein
MIMRVFKRCSALFLAALVATACAATPKQESTGQYVDDSWITTKVKSAILAEPSLKVTQINVETYKGMVQLSGFVDSPDAAAKAVELAREVKGVSSVKNDTRIR